MANRKQHRTIIVVRRKRRLKLNALRARYFNSRTVAVKKQIIEKAIHLNPYITEESFIASVKNPKPHPDPLLGKERGRKNKASP